MTANLKYSESGTGTIHLHDGTKKSLCGQNRAVTGGRGVHNNYAAHTVVAEEVGTVKINSDLCSHCQKSATDEDMAELFEMADEWESSQA